MQVISLVQQSQPWLQWRAEGLSGSDVASIMGLSPFCSREQLLAEKLGLSKREENSAMRRGTELEGMILHQVAQTVGIPFQPACIQHDEVDWARVSLDGFNGAKRQLVEVKAPNANVHAAALEGLVVEYYMVQIQYQLWCSGFEVGWYGTYNKAKIFSPQEQYSIVKVFEDPEMQAEIVTACEEFWLELCTAKTARKQQGVLVA